MLIVELAVRSRDCQAREQLLTVLDQIMRNVAIAAIGITLGLSGSLAVSGLTRSMLYDVVPTDTVTMALGALALFVLALVATALPANVSTRANPVEVLRSVA